MFVFKVACPQSHVLTVCPQIRVLKVACPQSRVLNVAVLNVACPQCLIGKKMEVEQLMHWFPSD